MPNIQKSAPQQGGEGLGTEALSAVLEYLTGTEGIQCVHAWCAASNTGSRRIMEKAGMVLTGTEPDGLEACGKVYDKLNFEYSAGDRLTWMQSDFIIEMQKAAGGR